MVYTISISGKGKINLPPCSVNTDSRSKMEFLKCQGRTKK